MEDKSNIPTLEDVMAQRPEPEFLKGDRWFSTDVSPYRLDFAKPYRPPRYTMAWKGVGFAPVGGIHAITGQSGHGKTMTLVQFMAAILAGKYGELSYNLSDEVPQPRVLYVDTEMEEENTIAVKNRVLTMCNRDIAQNYDDFIVMMLREVPATTETRLIKNQPRQVNVPASVMRWRMVLKSIYEYKPDVCFIDGLLDVVADFNDNQECQEIIYKCMQAASHYGISIWCVVHQNPGAEKLVGHLGSFLERKVTDVFQTKKDKKADGVVFTVSQKKSRGRDVDDWNFRVLPTGDWGMPEQLSVVPITKKESEEDLLKREADVMFKSYNWDRFGASYRALESYFAKPGMMGKRTYGKLFEVACASGIIYKAETGKYFYKGIGTPIPDDTVKQIPFEQKTSDGFPF